MTISCDWTTEERLLLSGAIAATAVEQMETGQTASDGMLHALEAIHRLQAMPAAYLETQRERLLEFGGSMSSDQ